MDANSERSQSIAERLLELGAATGRGEVDVDFYAMRLQTDAASVLRGLEELVARGLLAIEDRWQCSECGADMTLTSDLCADCKTPRSPGGTLVRAFLRPTRPPGRDPAAVFLVHGMNTLGSWQQSFSWKLHLLYGNSIPVFVFKFGRELLSPAARYSQHRRSVQLGIAVREAQTDLIAAGRNNRCDVIAHSFGTLLLSQLLDNAAFADLVFGRVILCGSIVPSRYGWDAHVANGRVEAVLNHRAGKDRWVRAAPWFFPDVGSSGVHGFSNTISVRDHLSVSFRHSDYFAKNNFNAVIRNVWTPFLNREVADASLCEDAQHAITGSDSRYWVGRILLIVIAALVTLLGLELAAVIGRASKAVLEGIGL